MTIHCRCSRTVSCSRGRCLLQRRFSLAGARLALPSTKSPFRGLARTIASLLSVSFLRALSSLSLMAWIPCLLIS